MGRCVHEKNVRGTLLHEVLPMFGVSSISRQPPAVLDKLTSSLNSMTTVHLSHLFFPG